MATEIEAQTRESFGVLILCILLLLGQWIHLEPRIARRDGRSLHKCWHSHFLFKGLFLALGGLHGKVILLLQGIHILHLELLPEHPELFGRVGVGSELVLLASIEEVEAGEDALVFLVVFEDLEDFTSGLLGDVVTVLAFDEVFALLIHQPVEVLVRDVLDVDPLQLEVPLELAMGIFPPKGEGLLVIARNEAGHTLEMAALDSAEEQVGVDLVLHVVTPVLLELMLVSVCRGPDPILDGLVDVVVVAAPDDHAPARLLLEAPFLQQ